MTDAEKWAKDLEQIPEQERGPLFGLPLSVKECYNVRDCDSTAGMAYYLNQPCEYDCFAVRKLKELGAVPFCLTNVPQTMMSLQCSNPAYGQTSSNSSYLLVLSKTFFHP